MNELRAISIFLRVAKLGSIRKAAVELGVAHQAASLAIAQLEKSMGVRLLHRTTRSLSLTEEGERFMTEIGPCLEALSFAMASAKRSREQLAGTLRVTAGRTGGTILIKSMIAEFQFRYPEIRLDLNFDARLTDWVESRVDVGLRQGLPPPGAAARELLPVQAIVCAAPSYLAKHGRPLDIDDLERHRCGAYRQPNTGKVKPWFFKTKEEIVQRTFVPCITMDDQGSQVEMVLSGAVIGQLPSYAVTEHIRAGRLVPLLTRHVAQSSAIYIYYGTRSQQSLRARALIDFLVEKVGNGQDFLLTAEELAAI